MPLSAAAACANSSHSQQDQAVASHIDHVIVGANDLNAGMTSFERLTGVSPVIGGEHPGRGTRNALVSLGDGTYLELIAPNPAERVESHDVRSLEALRAIKPIGWAVGVRDIEATRSKLRSQGFATSLPQPGSRRRPDGSLLEWQTFTFSTFEHDLAPFFIRWNNPRMHPSRTSPRGCKLASLQLLDPVPEKLAAAVHALRLNVSVEKAGEQKMVLELVCPKGTVALH